MKAFREQAARQRAELVTADVDRVDCSRPLSGYGPATTMSSCAAQTVIIATGAQAKWLGMESEQRSRARA